MCCCCRRDMRRDAPAWNLSRKMVEIKIYCFPFRLEISSMIKGRNQGSFFLCFFLPLSVLFVFWFVGCFFPKFLHLPWESLCSYNWSWMYLRLACRIPCSHTGTALCQCCAARCVLQLGEAALRPRGSREGLVQLSHLGAL